ncbi:MAG: eCIS core domain-containing protein [Nostoc sp.]
MFFREGEYNPGSQGGQELLTHVVQQNGGGEAIAYDT